MRSFLPTREFAVQMDNNDGLAHIKERFYIKPGQLYMDGNSLGLASKDGEQCVLRALEDWKNLGIGIWTQGSTNYFLYQDILGEKLARLINALPEEVTVCTNTTVNIHQCIATFYKPQKSKYKILVDELNFPTDRYAVKSQLTLHGYGDEALKTVKSRDGMMIEEDDIISAMTDDVALCLLPAVLYRSSQLLDLKRIAKAARERGIIIGFDLCHSIGAIDHNMQDVDCDFAVWCNYKYISGGPGAIAGLYVNKKHFGIMPGLCGWQGNKKETQFDMLLEFDPINSAGAFQTGTQPIFSMAAIEGALNIYACTTMKEIREKSLNITAYLMYLIELNLSKYGFTIGNPRQDNRRGGHVALCHSDAVRINEAMKARDIVPDYRPPDVIRLAPVALYVSYSDVYDLVERIAKIMENKEYERFSKKRGVVS